MALAGVSLKELNERATESADQGQTARMRSLILIYTFRKINPCPRKAG